MMSYPKNLFLSVWLISVFFVFGCATQGEVYTIDDRLAALERRQNQTQNEMGILKSSVGEFSQDRANDEQSIRGQIASLRLSVEDVRRQLQELNGRFEENNYVLGQKVTAIEESDRNRQTVAQRTESEISDLNRRISRIQQYLNLETTGPPTENPPPVSPPVAGESSPVIGAEDRAAAGESELYASAKQAFDGGKMEIARKGFQEMIKRFPKSERADNAQFWIGESYYREKWYEKAILEYQQVIEQYPNGNKVAASLLKQGFAFANLNDAANARLILRELVKKYPGSNEAAIARKKLESLK